MVWYTFLYPLWYSQCLHWYFTSLWTNCSCVLKWTLCLNCELHWLHWNISPKHNSQWLMVFSLVESLSKLWTGIVKVNECRDCWWVVGFQYFMIFKLKNFGCGEWVLLRLIKSCQDHKSWRSLTMTADFSSHHGLPSGAWWALVITVPSLIF